MNIPFVQDATFTGLISTQNYKSAEEWSQAYTLLQANSATWDVAQARLWGTITGNISAQTDLWAYLSANKDSQTLTYIPSLYRLSISNGNSVNLSSLKTEILPILPTVTNYLSTNNVLISSLDITEQLTVAGSISSNSSIYGNIGNSTQWNQAYNVATTYQNTSGNFVFDNDSRLSDPRDPNAHAASHGKPFTFAETTFFYDYMSGDATVRAVTAGVSGNLITLQFQSDSAKFEGTLSGMTESITIYAHFDQFPGTAGNGLTLTFDGSTSIDDAIFNGGDQMFVDSGEGGQIPDNGEEIVLEGGYGNTINEAISAWNASNPLNQAVLISGVGADIPMTYGGVNEPVLENGEDGALDPLFLDASQITTGILNAARLPFQLNQDLLTTSDVTFNTFNVNRPGSSGFFQIGNFYAPNNTTPGNNTFFRLGVSNGDNNTAQFGYRRGGGSFARPAFICFDFWSYDYLFMLAHDNGKPELWTRGSTGNTAVKLLTFGNGTGGGTIATELPISFGGSNSSIAANTRTNLGLDTASRMPSSSFAPSNLYQNLSGNWQSAYTAVAQGSSNWYAASGAAVTDSRNYVHTNFLPLTGGTISAVSGIEIANAVSGIIFRSPDGNRWRVTMTNSGTLSSVQL